MKFVHYSNLKSGAKKAIKRGPKRYRKYCVSRSGGVDYIATINPDGRLNEWVQVVYGGKEIV